jgi:hypothetical protein
MDPPAMWNNGDRRTDISQDGRKVPLRWHDDADIMTFMGQTPNGFCKTSFGTIEAVAVR